MTDIQQRIADILTGSSIRPDEAYDLYRLSEKNARYFAEVLVAELGLTREWTGHVMTRNAGVRRAAAEAAVAASKRTGRPVNPRVQKLADGKKQKPHA